VLAVYTAVLYPSGLLDETPTVLGLRTVAVPPELELDAVVPIESLAARLENARAEEGAPLRVGVPAEVHTVTWAGVAPPRTGWHAVGQVEASVLLDTARDGIVEVAAALPDNAGEAIVRRIRSEVWGRAIDGVDHVPAGAAFAAQSLGFLGDPYEPVPIHDNGPWTRLSTERGYVLVKRRAWSLQQG
jgi:hypothetical protein